MVSAKEEPVLVKSVLLSNIKDKFPEVSRCHAGIPSVLVTLVRRALDQHTGTI